MTLTLNLPHTDRCSALNLNLTSHLTARFGGTNIGDNVTFGCDNGYHLMGSSMIMCRGNGAWSDPVPTCSVTGGGIEHCSVPTP